MILIKREFRAFTCLSFLSASLLAQPTPEEIAYQLATRYTPYAEGAAVLDARIPSDQPVEAWWSTPEAIRAARNSFADPLSLSGLHLAIDPGHIGGLWAEWEGRHFRIADDDHWVREGELVLEVAQRIRTQLEALGAEVTLLRESAEPVNPKSPADYWAIAAEEFDPPESSAFAAQIDHALAIRNRAVKLAIVIGELAERARLVNEVIRPDALLSLHINAAPWPQGDALKLVDSDHAHVLVFGCLSSAELASSRQQERLAIKLANGSGSVEAELGAALGRALAEATGLPASDYDSKNAIRIDPEAPELWARNLMLLRLVDCPTVLLEPYIANSRTTYARLQKALAARAIQAPLSESDILVEYADAVVEAVRRVYGPETTVFSWSKELTGCRLGTLLIVWNLTGTQKKTNGSRRSETSLLRKSPCY